MDVPAWFGHLRRDRRGIVVPVVNRWGPERDENIVVEFDPLVGRPAVFNYDAEETEPDFTHQSPQRQRYSMLTGHCQVCGREIPNNRRYLVLDGFSTETIEIDGETRNVVIEPWLDKVCAVFAMEHCPALIRRTRDSKLKLYHVPDADKVDVIISTAWVDGEHAEETRRNPAVMWAKLLPKDLEIVRIPG